MLVPFRGGTCPEGGKTQGNPAACHRAVRLFGSESEEWDAGARPIPTLMATWIVGDIHGCSNELDALIGKLDIGTEERLISVGDLFHRGPDPAGVMDLLREAGALFVLGNHELRVLRRFGLAPSAIDGRDRPRRRRELGALADDALLGDGGSACDVPFARRAEVLEFLQDHAGYLLEHTSVHGAGPTPDGRSWCVVHAGVVPGRPLCDNCVEDLTRLRRVDGPGRPYWYEVYGGPELVLFGHTPSRLPRVERRGSSPVAIGLDTGCVYGGSLTAYSPELDEFVRVPAARTYAKNRGTPVWTARR